MTEKNRAKLTLLAVVTLFIAPIVGAYYVYFFQQEGLHQNTTNIGSFINPPLPIEKLKLSSIQKPNDKWLLVYMHHDECKKECLFNLKKLASIHYALGKDSLDATELLVLPQDLADKNKINDQLNKDQQVSYTDTSQLRANIAFNSTTAPSRDLFMIIDPQGNAMMHYDAKVEGIGMLQDVRRLIKVANG